MSRFLANKISIACRIDCFSEAPSTKFGEVLHMQVEERLAFYETGKPTTKNSDAMRKAIAAIEEAAGDLMDVDAEDEDEEKDDEGADEEESTEKKKSLKTSSKVDKKKKKKDKKSKSEDVEKAAKKAAKKAEKEEKKKKKKDA